jgi:hypothetical protein
LQAAGGAVEAQYATMRRRFVREARWEDARAQLRATAAVYSDSRARLGWALQALHGVLPAA